ncbi:hypothetical protein QBZ16_000710 [Prototheca wickerhamii]|uniref:Uncharacterized protein n=1 Tax=Prototheca wickerhamii TaxID=3111 RepID=A0AAD9ILU6_PROWI|nr:hypothetical protein QBZ16_000710 [Prototheca wickerhamii]
MAAQLAPESKAYIQSVFRHRDVFKDEDLALLARKANCSEAATRQWLLALRSTVRAFAKGAEDAASEERQRPGDGRAASQAQEASMAGSLLRDQAERLSESVREHRERHPRQDTAGHQLNATALLVALPCRAPMSARRRVLLALGEALAQPRLLRALEQSEVLALGLADWMEEGARRAALDRGRARAAHDRAVALVAAWWPDPGPVTTPVPAGSAPPPAAPAAAEPGASRAWWGTLAPVQGEGLASPGKRHAAPEVALGLAGILSADDIRRARHKAESVQLLRSLDEAEQLRGGEARELALPPRLMAELRKSQAQLMFEIRAAQETLAEDRLRRALRVLAVPARHGAAPAAPGPSAGVPWRVRDCAAAARLALEYGGESTEARVRLAQRAKGLGLPKRDPRPTITPASPTVSNSGPSTATADPAEQRIPLFPTDATEVEQQVSIMLKKGVRAPDYLFP